MTLVEPGARAPAVVEGVDVDGERVSVTDLLDRHARVLVYFYPFDERAEPPPAWQLLRDHRDRLVAEDVAVVGVRGPGLATRDAAERLDELPFPLVEDPNYRLGQAFRVLGDRTGDDLDRPDVQRAFVLLGAGGRVLDARRDDEPDALRKVLGDVL